MSLVRDLKLAVVVVLVLLALPLLLDCWKGGTTGATRMDVWDWLWGPSLGVEDTWVRGIEVIVGEWRTVGVGLVPGSETVASG